MKTVTVTYTFQVDEATPESDINNVAANGYVQFTEPVVGWDSSGNEIEADFGPVTMNVEVR